MAISWRDIAKEPAPRDRPVALLSAQPQPAGGQYVSFDVCQWRTEHGCFTIGFGFDTQIGHGCATHWCEVDELNLPEVASADQP